MLPATFKATPADVAAEKRRLDNQRIVQKAQARPNPAVQRAGPHPHRPQAASKQKNLPMPANIKKASKVEATQVKAHLQKQAEHFESNGLPSFADDLKKSAAVDFSGALGDLGKTRKSGEKMPTGRRLCLLYTSPSPRDKRQSRMPSSA